MILVTGGAGFIGSHLTEALVGAGHAVRVLDDLSTGFRRNLAKVASAVDLVEGAVQDPLVVRAAMDGVRQVFHLAACPSVARSQEDPVGVHEQNATGTLVVLDEAARAGVARLVFASSSSLYGITGERPGREDDPPHPLSPYAAQKLLGEHYCRIWSSTRGLPTVILRFFNVFGPRQDPGSPYSGVISLFCRAMLAGEVPVVHGDGRQVRDFTYVENVVRALLRAAEAEVPPGRIFNIATGRSRTLLELYEFLRQDLGGPESPRFGPARPGDVRYSYADVERARQELGFEATVGFQDGLQRTLDWFRPRDPKEHA